MMSFKPSRDTVDAGTVYEVPERPLVSISAPGPERHRGDYFRGGSLGVRGFIQDVHGHSFAEVVQDLTHALQSLSGAGLRRVHLLSPPEAAQGSRERLIRSAARECGFHDCPGEKLFTRVLDVRPSHLTPVPDGYELRDGSRRDLLTIGLTLTNVRELAFESWEFPLISNSVGRKDRFFKVIERRGELVGVSIGGAHGERGTITHTWVHPDHRWSPASPTHPRLGKLLSDESLRALYDGGARAVHLMTVDGNPAADKFWPRQGFQLEDRGSFLEIDL